MNELYNIIDAQLLSLLSTWAQIHRRLMHDSLLIPDDGYDRYDDGEEVPEIALCDAEDEMLQGIELAARKLISSAEDARLISLEDWRTLNAIIINMGGDCPENAERLWWRFK